MSDYVVQILEELCDASDDCVYSELRGTTDEIERSRDNFSEVWDNAVDKLSKPTITNYLKTNEAMLTKTKAKMVTLESLRKFAGLN